MIELEQTLITQARKHLDTITRLYSIVKSEGQRCEFDLAWAGLCSLTELAHAKGSGLSQEAAHLLCDLDRECSVVVAGAAAGHSLSTVMVELFDPHAHAAAMTHVESIVDTASGYEPATLEPYFFAGEMVAAFQAGAAWQSQRRAGEEK